MFCKFKTYSKIGFKKPKNHPKLSIWISAIILFNVSLTHANEKTTLHSLQVGEESLVYTATVASGEVSYIAYVKQTTENRPITFAFNGGPGSSSVWLHIGAFGPRRLLSPEEGQALTPPYQMVDNTETLLDLTDLVFIDPSGTGLSSINPENYSIEKDIQSIGKFIRNYLTKNKRWNSPKYIAGESYGAIRGSGLADYLQNEFSIYLNGLIFISAALDYQNFIFDTDNLFPYFLFLPSYATTAWYHHRYHSDVTLEEVAQEARDFTYQTYAPSLIYPKFVEKESLYQQISKLTSLPIEIVKKNCGKISDELFFFEFLSDQQKVIGRFDSRCTGYYNALKPDPSYDLINGSFAAAFHDFLHKELEFQDSYTLLSMDVNESWDYRNYNEWGYPNLIHELRCALTTNPALKLFVGCGYFDLATPFATIEYCLDHLAIPNLSLQLEYYEGGHMYYLNPAARIKFKQDLIRFYQNQ